MNTELPMFVTAIDQIDQIDFNNTNEWVSVEADRNNQEAMEWLAVNCFGGYYKYYASGGYYVKFSHEPDAIMFQLKFA